MKKIKFLLSIFAIFFFFTINVSADEGVNRVVNIVYDDSSSMIYNYKEREYVDYWAKAKFSLELLCSSLDTSDTVNIYPMSDYSDYDTGLLAIDDYKDDKEPLLTLTGSMSAEERVSAIDNMVTEALDTPFYAVGKAFYDLSQTEADEKWLVVLTDGEFDEVISDEQLSNQFYSFKEYNEDVKIMYIGMDSEVFKIAEDEDNDIFTEYADNPEEILNNFTRVSYRIFNRNEISVSSGNRIKFDVPMEKLVIFAKGNNVEINSIVHPGGEIYEPSLTVNIPVSDIAASNYEDNNKVIYDTSLTGEVAVFEYQINEGNYRIDVDNADDLEVFYYPSVGVTVNLVDSKGIDVYGQEEINSGEYTVKYEFINTQTGEKLDNTELLGNIVFTTSLIRNDEVILNEINDGDTITLEPGLDRLIVEAKYLTYNSIEANFEFNVVDYHPMIFSIVKMPEYSTTLTGVDNIEEPIVIALTLNNEVLTDDMWNNMPLPEIISLDSISNALVYKVEKSSEKGIFNIYLDAEESEFSAENLNAFLINGEFMAEPIYYSGQLNVTVNMVDSVPQFIRTAMDNWLIIVLLLILLILSLFLLRKEMPRVIYFQINKVLVDGVKSNEDIEFEYKRNNKELTVTMFSIFDNNEFVKFNLKPTEPRIISMIAKPDSIIINNIEASDLITEITIDNESYLKKGNVWVHSKNRDKPKPLKGNSNIVVIKIANGVEVKIYGSIQRF